MNVTESPPAAASERVSVEAQRRPTVVQSLIEIRQETPEKIAIEAMVRLLDQGHPLVVLFSAGKDSSVLANLAATAAAKVVRGGRRALLVAAHADVLVENPEIARLARGELEKFKRFCRATGIDVAVRVARPAFWDSFAVRVLGGRALPTFPDTRRDCTTDWKRLANARELASLWRDLAGQQWAEPVLMTGVRRDESAVRSRSVASRGEQSGKIWTDADGRLRLSPLLEWTTDDIWIYLALCNAGVVEAYSDFEATMQIYQAAGGSSCVVVADAELDRNSKPCSSRFGCWVCTAVREDKSLHQMIESDPAQFGYMRPLAALRDFIANTQYDWSRRQHVGRTIEQGHVMIAADTYSPGMLAELLRYSLTAQRVTGVQIVDAAQLLAIDARWSQYAIAPPFSALRIWREVERGARWMPPRAPRARKTPVPRLGLISVGEDWNDDVESDLLLTGLRDHSAELFAESCGPRLKQLASGRDVLDVEGDSEVDVEDAWLFLDFEMDRMLAERAHPDQDWTNGYRTYVSMGLIRPAKGTSRRVDEILRRSQWRQRNDLHGQRDPRELQKRLSVRFPQQADLFDPGYDNDG